MSNHSSRSNSPIDKDFDELLSGNYKKNTAPKTPPRTSSYPKGLSPLKESFKLLHDARRNISSTLSEFPEIDSGDSQGSMDSGKTDSVYSDDDEFSKKLEREAAKHKEISRKLREQFEERKKRYATMSEKEVEAAEKKRRNANRINNKLKNWGNSKLEPTTAGRRKKRKTKKNNKRNKRTQKKNKRKNKKSRKTRSKRQRGGNTEDNKFVVAAMQGKKEDVEKLLNKGVDVDAVVKEDSWTALIWASRKGHTDIVELLLNNGANVNLAPYSGVSALHLASKYGHKQIVELLLNKGADVNAETSGKFTALILASEQGNIDIVKLLLDNGADVNAKTTSGRTALIWARENRHENIVKLLEDAIEIRKKKDDAMEEIEQFNLKSVPSLATMAKEQLTTEQLKELRELYPVPPGKLGGRRKKTQKKSKKRTMKRNTRRK
jgi:ankyrin repeat protein